MISVDTLKWIVSVADYKIKNEAPGVQFFRSEVPKNLQGLSPLSSASLYRNTQTSTPCAILAKSRLSTFSLRYFIISGGNVIVIDTLLRAMHINNVQLLLYMCNFNISNAHRKCAGTSQYDKTQSISESYETSHSPADKCTTERNISRDNPRRGLSLGHVHRETDRYNQGQSEQWTHSFSGPGIQNRDHEGVCA